MKNSNPSCLTTLICGFLLIFLISTYDEDTNTSTSSTSYDSEYSSYEYNYSTKSSNSTRSKVDSMKIAETNRRVGFVVRNHLSKEYQEGYDQGYADGEDDAINHNGWQDEYNPITNYKGQKRKDFLTGYDEGYINGYDDNRDDDDYEF